MKREKLIAARYKLHMSREELAERVGVDQNTLYRWESGQALPRGYNLRALCDALGMTAEALELEKFPEQAEQQSGARRSKLIAARRRNHWSQEQAAEALDVDTATLQRWERGETMPRDYNVVRICEVYRMPGQELGLETAEHASLFQVPVQRPLIFTDPTMRLFTVAFAPRLSSREIQSELAAILEEDAMNHDPISRRETLRRLAGLPFITLHLGERDAPSHAATEIIHQCAAALTACWTLSRSKEYDDVILAFRAASSYLAVLKPIVAESSQHRKDSAELAAQCALLKTLLGWHIKGPQAAMPYAQEALAYARESGDTPLLLSVLDYSSWLYYYNRRAGLALSTSEQALPLLKAQSSAALPSRLVGGVYSTLAVMQAKNGQEAETSTRKAAQAFFTPKNIDKEQRFIYMDYTASEITLNEGMVDYLQGDYAHALVSLGQLIDTETLALKMPLPERSHIEGINLMALSALKSRERDMEHVIHCWSTAIEGAKQLQSEQRFNESLITYEIMEAVWPGEPRITELRESALHW